MRYALDFIARRGLSFFGWWRLLVGGIGLGALAVLSLTDRSGARRRWAQPLLSRVRGEQAALNT